MIDIDLFKQVNDRFGHATGDAVLREVANLLRHECRAIDIISHGGEEFALALPGSDLRAGITLCERIRHAFCLFDWSCIAPSLAVTVSAGGSAWSAGLNAPELLAAADSSLYEAKHAGRNRVRPAHADQPLLAARRGRCLRVREMRLHAVVFQGACRPAGSSAARQGDFESSVNDTALICVNWRRVQQAHHA